jgi:dynein heavy chain
MIDQELGYLPNQEELGELRYHFYTHNGLDAVNIAALEQPWLDKMWDLIPRYLKVDYYAIAVELCDEVCDEYRVAVKRAMVDFVLHEPDKKALPQLDSGAKNDETLQIVPKPWHESFLRSKRKLLRNLHAYNPVLGYVNSVWIGVFG